MRVNSDLYTSAYRIYDDPVRFLLFDNSFGVFGSVLFVVHHAHERNKGDAVSHVLEVTALTFIRVSWYFIDQNVVHIQHSHDAAAVTI